MFMMDLMVSTCGAYNGTRVNDWEKYCRDLEVMGKAW